MSIDYIIHFLITYKYAVLLPIAIPEGPIIAVIAGFLSSQGILDLSIAFVIIVLGDLIGDALWYWIARRYGLKILLRYGHFLKITREKIDIFEKHLKKNFFKTMLFGKITNVPMLSIILAAGITKIDFKKFITLVFFLAIPKTFILLFIGYHFGQSYSLIGHYMDIGSRVILFVILGALLFYFTSVYVKKFTGNDKELFNVNKYVNIDYLKPIAEGGLVRKCAKNIERIACTNNKILIIAPCLIGDFTASMPAISDYIQRNKDKTIDIVVTSVLKKLVQRMHGIHFIYVSKSATERSIEVCTDEHAISGEYEQVIILRASQDVLDNIIPRIKAEKVRHVVEEVTRYSIFELVKNNILRRRPKQWRAFNFELLGGTPRHIPFGEILDFTEEECQNIVTPNGVRTGYKKVIIHTGASWPMMRWSNEKWIELLKRINRTDSFDFIFIGSGKDGDDFDLISSHLDFPVFSLISQVSMIELVLVMHSADYFLGIDSGPGNIAHLVGLRSLILYGPGPHTFMSDDGDDVIIDKSNGRGFYQRYFLKKKGFIDQINVDEVARAFEEMHNGGMENGKK